MKLWEPRRKTAAHTLLVESVCEPGQTVTEIHQDYEPGCESQKWFVAVAKLEKHGYVRKRKVHREHCRNAVGIYPTGRGKKLVVRQFPGAAG